MANPVRPADGSKWFATEAQFQAACVMWFNNYYRFNHHRMLHANDNNSSDNIEGNKKKAMGVVRGVSDLELILDHGKTCYIELKLPGKTQSKEQIDFENKLLERGHFYVIIETLNQFKSLIWNLLGDHLIIGK